MANSQPDSASPELVIEWLTGKRPFLLSRTEQDLDVILECSFSIDQLIDFYETPNSLMNRRYWIAAALRRTIELLVEGDFDELDPKPDSKVISMLTSFVSTHMAEFKTIGYGHDPNCPVIEYIELSCGDAHTS